MVKLALNAKLAKINATIKTLLEGIINCHSADIDHCQIIQGIKEFGE